MGHRTAEPTDLPKHHAALAFFNRLVIDLKHIEIKGTPVEPVTMERLNEATKHLDDLERCRERTRFS